MREWPYTALSPDTSHLDLVISLGQVFWPLGETLRGNLKGGPVEISRILRCISQYIPPPGSVGFNINFCNISITINNISISQDLEHLWEKLEVGWKPCRLESLYSTSLPSQSTSFIMVVMIMMILNIICWRWQSVWWCWWPSHGPSIAAGEQRGSRRRTFWVNVVSLQDHPLPGSLSLWRWAPWWMLWRWRSAWWRWGWRGISLCIVSNSFCHWVWVVPRHICPACTFRLILSAC